MKSIYSYAIIAGEWWDRNPIDVIKNATRFGAAPDISDAFTINGQPGDLYPCSSKGDFNYEFYCSNQITCTN
jgi:Multicopper oxidase